MSHALPCSPAFPSQARILVLVLISCCPKFSCGTSSQTLTTPTKTPPSGLGGLFSSPDPFLPSPLCWYWVLLLCLACQKTNSPSAQIQHPVLALRRAPRASRRLRSALGRPFFFSTPWPFFLLACFGNLPFSKPPSVASSLFNHFRVPILATCSSSSSTANLVFFGLLWSRVHHTSRASCETP